MVIVPVQLAKAEALTARTKSRAVKTHILLGTSFTSSNESLRCQKLTLTTRKAVLNADPPFFDDIFLRWKVNSSQMVKK